MEKARTPPTATLESFDEKDSKHAAQFLEDDNLDDLPPSYLAASERSEKDSLTLELSSNWSTLNSTYSLRSGLPIYRTDTLNSLVAPRITTIEKIQSSCGPEDRFYTLARIKYHTFSPTQIEMNNGRRARWSLGRRVCIVRLTHLKRLETPFLGTIPAYPR
ncbi:hypothetical protein DL96DRAFT_1620803 [Flagelloscypha sp. PMI_526]|nr:hypothetical protein DL96DRAFT_1620803 [Flagelloscypha sp. PMI_526]